MPTSPPHPTSPGTLRRARRLTELAGGALTAALLIAGFTAVPARAAGGATHAYHGLFAAYDNVAISAAEAPSTADIDGDGDSIDADDLTAAGWTPGASVTVDGARLSLPDVPPGHADNVVADGQRVDLSGSGTALSFLATSTDGTAAGSGVITYADGHTQTYQLSVPDWIGGPSDLMTVSLPHWNTPSGPQGIGGARLYTLSVPLASGLPIRSVTLPTAGTVASGSPAMHVFAIAVRPSSGAWTATWSAAMDDGLVPGPWTDRTLRMVEHTSIGGSDVRVRLDNDFAPSPVTIGHATIAVEASGSSALATPRTLRFAGHEQVTIPAGGQAISDPLDFTVPADTNLLISLYFPGTVNLAPLHSDGQQTMYSTSDNAGDQTTAVADYPTSNTFGFWTILSGIDVLAPRSGGAVVAFGDSITDGYQSTVDANARWPNDLARRLLAQHTYPRMGVVDEGISANQVIGDLFNGVYGSGNGGIKALARLDRDMISQSNVRTVIVLEGINDLDNAGAQAPAIIAGLEQIAATARSYGLRVLVGTLTPTGGCSCHTAANEQVREQVNEFIRNNGGRFDGVIDFDAAVRDPSDPLRMLPAYDSGDHLHPNDAGYQAMANAIDLATLR